MRRGCLWLLGLLLFIVGCSSIHNYLNSSLDKNTFVVNDSVASSVISAGDVSTRNVSVNETQITTQITIKESIDNSVGYNTFCTELSNKTILNSCHISNRIVYNITVCSAQWVCLNSKTKIYRVQNCSFTQRVDCKFGCKNDSCAIAPVCKAGWNCDGNYYRGYRMESCEFIKREKCEFGCREGDCSVEVVENTSTIIVKTGVEEARPALATLNSGDMVLLKNHNVTIYTMTDEQVILIIDGRKSNLLKEGESVTRDDLTIVVEEILFQAYGEGKKMISYTVT